MQSYSQNPNLDLKTVKTVNDETEYRVNCRPINGKFYIKNKDCFLLDGKWVRVNSGLITYDYELKKWVRNSEKQKMINGIVDVAKDGSYVIGDFTPNPFNNCTAIINNGRHIKQVLNPDIMYDNNFVENVTMGYFLPKKELSKEALASIIKPKNNPNNQNKGYNIEDNAAEFVNKVNLFKGYQPALSKDVRRYARFIGDTTFGVEMETIRGYLPDHIQHRVGTVVCRDGSLRDDVTGGQGAEFVTIPLSGAKGLQNIVNLCTELSKRTEININCSVHIHLGNIPTSRLDLVSVYMLCLKIQNEIFQMFPYYKTNPKGIKEKNYNQKLKRIGMYALNDFSKDDYSEYINSAYQRLFTFLTEGVQSQQRFNRKNKMHPAGSQKWNKHSRYFWINFMNTIFSERGTLEFRPHHGTLNSQKVINWLFIVNAIVKYASLHSKEIITTGAKISLKDVVGYYAESFKTDRAKFLSDYLSAYINERKEKFSKDIDKGDHLSMDEIEKDLEYTFNYKGVTNLF